ncbi:MAG: toll/interleukin-1 receptor domain-containing protein [Devosia sp.]
MPDIFISYKKEERAVAALLASRFTEAGYDVWWDDALLAGERFEDEISAVLDESRVVVVLWSKLSVVSDWVKAEAETARQQKKALPTIIDDLPPGKLPLLYRGMHVARLREWAGDNDHAGFVELMGSIEDRLGTASGPKLSPLEAKAKLVESVDEAKQIIAAAPTETVAPAKPAAAATAGRRWIPWWAIVLPIVALLGVVGGLVYSQIGRTSPSDQAAVERCKAWSTSAKLDWVSGFPRLDATTPADCATAVELSPIDGNYLGMLAMVRIVQGSSYAAEAVSLANRGAEKNGAAAYYALGGMYGRGLGVTGDPVRAATNLKTSADLGNLRAAGRLCLMAMDGNMSLPITITRDDISALCKRAVEGGDALGQLATGLAFELGTDGRTVNAEAAVQYYRQAADQGLDEAAVRLGALYDHGIGVERDFGKAVALYQNAANFGFAAAIRSYGVSLELGNGIPAGHQQGGTDV